MLRVAVLVGGSGSNLQALIDAQDDSYKITSVISHVAGVRALQRAVDAGIASQTIAHRDFKDRNDFDIRLAQALDLADVDLVCLAGFMRLLSADLVARWQGRMLNIHPSLLPAFKGLHTHRRALQAGVAIHGCTVHQVTAELDDGPILMQAAVPVLIDDDEQTLADRVLRMEHLCYPKALKNFVAGQQKGVPKSRERLLLDPQLKN